MAKPAIADTQGATSTGPIATKTSLHLPVGRRPAGNPKPSIRPHETNGFTMSTQKLPLARPRIILFDWHATLVDTLDAMYHAVDDVLPQLEELRLLDRVLKSSQSKTEEDAKLVSYIRRYRRLHPKIKAARKISRTDIFELLFGPDEEAKRIAHQAFDRCYRNHYGEVHPMEPGMRENLETLIGMGVRLGVISNRSREFMSHEIAVVDGTGWENLFETMVCGDDVLHRKPAPDVILQALDNLGAQSSAACWYVGDSTTDVIAAKEAGVTSVFYNGAHWDAAWIKKIFPGTRRHPHRPDAVVDDLPALLAMARRLMASDD